MDQALNWISAVCAFLAAAFWFASARIRLPKEITTGYGGVGGSAQILGNRLRLQANLSALGAFFAGVAATTQGIALIP